MMAVHKMRISGVMEEIPRVCAWVVQRAENFGLDMRDVNHCELAVDEAITNIVEHGYGGHGADYVVDIAITEAGDRFMITIADDSEPFDPLQMEDPDPLSELEARPEHGGGYGLFFIKKVMDQVWYDYIGNRNQLTMVKIKR
jgi:serine/threonine-protein kinase RsbW